MHTVLLYKIKKSLLDSLLWDLGLISRSKFISTPTLSHNNLTLDLLKNYNSSMNMDGFGIVGNCMWQVVVLQPKPVVVFRLKNLELSNYFSD